MLKEFSCNYCQKVFWKNDNNGKKQGNKNDYCSRSHYLAYRKEHFDKEQWAKVMEARTKAGAEAKRNKMSNFIKGNVSEWHEKQQKKVTKQILEEVTAENIPPLQQIYKEAKSEIVGIVKEQNLSIETDELMLKIGKSVVKKLHDMWKNAEISGDVTLMRKYKEWFVVPLIGISSEIRKYAKDIHEMQYGKKLVIGKEVKTIEGFLEIKEAEPAETQTTKVEKNENNRE